VRVTLVLPRALRAYACGESSLAVEVPEGATVAVLLDEVEAAHPGVSARARDETGQLREHVNVFVAGESVRARDGLATTLAAGDEVMILPAVSGGG
jgi:MoaD family protein